jgi:prepilin-type N-terminal cleavage/methylation domain-containing protein
MKKNNGFTLVELMIVLAIVGILVTLVLPGMRTYLSNSASGALSNTLYIDIMYARNHAITKEIAVIMVPLGIDPNPDNADAADTGASTFTPNSAGVNWGLGWRIVEVDGDAIASNNRIIRNQGSFGPGAHISSGPGAHFNVGPEDVLDRANPIGFNADGTSMGPGALTVATFGCAGDNARLIQINQIGQVIGNNIDCPVAFTNL